MESPEEHEFTASTIRNGQIKGKTNKALLHLSERQIRFAKHQKEEASWPG
jgi:hypothetical protein